jgi:hypothetical protein
LECGLTLDQVLELSPARLKLLSKAARKREASRAMLELEMMRAAFAAVMCKGGNAPFKSMRAQLEKRLKE